MDPNGSPWLFVAPPGPSWLLVAPGPSWPLLVVLGRPPSSFAGLTNEKQPYMAGTCIALQAQH